MFVNSSHIVRTITSEKTFKLLENGFYSFIVNKKLNKHQIAGAIQTLFGVKPLSVNTINTKPYSKGFKGQKGTIGAIKKAIVKMPEGFKLDAEAN
jgi:large subunit ribosomal protein L23